MRKSFVTLALAFAIAATAQQATPPAGGQSPSSAQPGQSGQPVQSAQPGQAAQPGQEAQPGQAAQPGQVTIKDPAEYNAYVTALQQTDPAAKAQALEAF